MLPEPAASSVKENLAGRHLSVCAGCVGYHYRDENYAHDLEARSRYNRSSWPSGPEDRHDANL